jgi:hypothetical protein
MWNVRRKIDLLLHPADTPYDGTLDGDQIPLSSDPDAAFSLLPKNSAMLHRKLFRPF